MSLRPMMPPNKMILAILALMQATAAFGAGQGQAAAAKPIGDPGQWFGPDNYPPAAMRAGEQGRSVVTLAINDHGMPTSCTIRISSGSVWLDDGTCAVAMAHITFEPARDVSGKPIAAQFPLAVRWVLPKKSEGIGAEVTFAVNGDDVKCTMHQPSGTKPLEPAICAALVDNIRANGGTLDHSAHIELFAPTKKR